MPTADEPSTRPPIVAAIILNEGRVLMVRRRAREGSLSWQFPAGELEPGETVEQTAAREVTEEVGLGVAPQRVLGDRVHPVTKRQMFYVACKPTGSTAAKIIDTEELNELAWCTLTEMNDRVPAGVFQPVLDYLEAALS